MMKFNYRSSRGASVVEYALISVAFVLGVVVVANGDSIKTTMADLVGSTLNASASNGTLEVPSYGGEGVTGSGVVINTGDDDDTTDDNDETSNTGGGSSTNVCELMASLCDDNGEVVIDVAAGLGSEQITELFELLQAQLESFGIVATGVDGDGNPTYSCDGGECHPLLTEIYELAQAGYILGDDVGTVEGYCQGDGNGGATCESTDHASATAQFMQNMDDNIQSFISQWYDVESWAYECSAFNSCAGGASPFSAEQWDIVAMIIDIASINTLNIAATVHDNLHMNDAFSFSGGSIQIDANSDTVCGTSIYAGYTMTCMP